MWRCHRFAQNMYVESTVDPAQFQMLQGLPDLHNEVKERYFQGHFSEAIKSDHEKMKKIMNQAFVQFNIIESQDTVLLVRPFIHGDNLDQYLLTNKNIYVKDRFVLVKRIVELLMELHKNGIPAYSFKPNNIIFSDGDIYLVDVGYKSIYDSHQKCNPLPGDMLYMGPEMLFDSIDDAFARDIWDLGLIISIIFTGEMPYQTRNAMKMLQEINKGVFLPQSLDSIQQKLISGILTRHKDSRLTIEQIQHIVVEQINFYCEATSLKFGKHAAVASSLCFAKEYGRGTPLNVPNVSTNTYVFKDLPPGAKIKNRPSIRQRKFINAVPLPKVKQIRKSFS